MSAFLEMAGNIIQLAAGLPAFKRRLYLVFAFAGCVVLMGASKPLSLMILALLFGVAELAFTILARSSNE